MWLAIVIAKKSKKKIWSSPIEAENEKEAMFFGLAKFSKEKRIKVDRKFFDHFFITAKEIENS